MSSIAFPRNKSDHQAHPWPGAGQKLVIHYTLHGHVVCEAEHRLSADARFVELPIPVIYELKRGLMR